jgi:hypothetical protein
VKARWVALLLLAALPLAVQAQVIRGLVLRADSITPMPQALIEWRDQRGAAQRLLTDERGRFTVSLEQPGSVALRILRPGYRPHVVAPIALRVGQAVDARIVLNEEAVVLSTVRVESQGACTGRADGVAWTLWEQARVAIQSANLAERDAALRIAAIAFDADAEPTGALVLRDSSIRLAPTGEPRAAAERDSIFRFGYVRRTSDTSYYVAPTPDVLTDERFAPRYCFAMVPPDSAPEGLHGVHFTPQRRPGPGIADVMGTLWVDRDRLHLQAVEFTHLNVPVHHRTPGLGGRLEYMDLPSGHWLLRAWQVRMPEFSPFGPVAGLWAQGRTVFRVEQGGVELYADSTSAALLGRGPSQRR